jgi:hypothetical protein
MNMHVLWGWLQIDDCPDVNKENITGESHPWYKEHPHVSHPNRENNNVIYIAKEYLDISKLNISGLKGYGVFPKFDSRLQLTSNLTENGEKNHRRSFWCLPQWFEDNLSCHSDKSWGSCEEDKKKVFLKSAPIGQEFIIDISDKMTVAVEWLKGIFACANTQ